MSPAGRPAHGRAPVVRAHPPVHVDRRVPAAATGGDAVITPSLASLCSLDGRAGDRHRRGPGVRRGHRRTTRRSRRAWSSSPTATSRAPSACAPSSSRGRRVRGRRGRHRRRGSRSTALFEHAGPVDILVNNAGVFSNDDGDRAARRRVRPDHRRSTCAARSSARASSPAAAWPKDGAASIVNVASVDALAPSCEGQVHYTASKHAVAGLTKSLSVELAPHGIRVNAVCPGAAMTEGAVAFVAGRSAPRASTSQAQWAGIAERTPIGRLIEPDDVARAVLFLASDLAAQHHRRPAAGRRRDPHPAARGLRRGSAG